MKSARLAVDIGGTFTDLALEAGGQRTTAKVLTTSAAPEQGVMEGFRTIIQAAGVAPADIGLIIHGTTLVTNAIRPNLPSGRIEVITGVRAGHPAITVTNTGPVVPASAVASLFEPFTSRDGRVSNGHSVGLGLSIVTSVVNAHHGHLHAEALPTGGMKISVRLPKTTLSATPHDALAVIDQNARDLTGHGGKKTIRRFSCVFRIRERVILAKCIAPPVLDDPDRTVAGLNGGPARVRPARAPLTRPWPGTRRRASPPTPTGRTTAAKRQCPTSARWPVWPYTTSYRPPREWRSPWLSSAPSPGAARGRSATSGWT